MSRNISNCEVGWPRAGEGNQRIPQGTALGCGELRMSKMETPSLTPLRHFFSLSPEIQPRFLAPYLWTFIYSGNKISFCWPGCFVSPLWIFPSLLIQEKGTSPIPKLSGTAGIALQTPTDTFGSSFGFVFRAWLLLQLELQKHHMHWEKEKKKKSQHLVLSVFCHKPDLLPVLTFFPSSSWSESWGIIPRNPSPGCGFLGSPSSCLFSRNIKFIAFN